MTTQTQIDWTKPVQTIGGVRPPRDKKPVTIISTEARGEYPVIGYVGDSITLARWTIKGKWSIHGERQPIDLENIPEWHLPDPPEGYEWAQVGDWKEGDLALAERPLLIGEERQAGDMLLINDDWINFDQQATYERDKFQKKTSFRAKTSRPLPPPKPKLREVQLCADDIKAGDEFLLPNGNRYAWSQIAKQCISLDTHVKTFESLMEAGWKIRSIGETEWRKCSKMEEVPA